MAKFLKPLVVEPIPGPDLRWILTDHLPFQSDKYRGVFIVPAGYQTDLASIPAIAWGLFPKRGKYDPASVVHDAGYTHGLLTEHGERINTVKAVADDLFLEGMQAERVNWLRARLMVSMVRAFGNPDSHPLAANRLPAGIHGLVASGRWDPQRGLAVGEAGYWVIR